MKFKIIVLIILFFSVTLSSCGRKAEPLKPSEIIEKK
jgi:predicted small lipoprotein YifL